MATLTEKTEGYITDLTEDFGSIVEDNEDTIGDINYINTEEIIHKNIHSNCIKYSPQEQEKTVTLGTISGEFSIPVGDVICKDTSPITQIWWCPKDKMGQIKKLCKDWTSNGFKLYTGVAGRGSWFYPEVIEHAEQERVANGLFARSTKMCEAHIGDSCVWLGITDPQKARDFMQDRTDIPVAVRCDMDSYTSDLNYKAAFDIANDLFIYYFVNKRPKRARSQSLSKEDLHELYNL